MDRRYKSVTFLMRLGEAFAARICDPETGQWPSEILAALDDIHLIAACFTMLGKPDRLCLGVNGHRLNISVSIGPDGSGRAIFIHKGVIIRDLAVQRQTDDRSVLAAKILRYMIRTERLAVAIAEPDENVIILKNDA